MDRTNFISKMFLEPVIWRYDTSMLILKLNRGKWQLEHKHLRSGI